MSQLRGGMIKSWFSGSRSKVREMDNPPPSWKLGPKPGAPAPSNRISINRYLSAPLEEEAASIPAIKAALSGQPSPNPAVPEAEPPFDSRSLAASVDQPSSDGQRTFYTSASSSISTGTSYSATSDSHRVQRSRAERSEEAPAVPHIPKAYAEHGESPHAATLLRTEPSKATVGRIPSNQTTFYCTFCDRCFRNRQDWLHHEQRVHMRGEVWVCCPPIPTALARCPFCPKAQPNIEHLATHNYHLCQDRPLRERTFRRKDRFLQHIAQRHELRIWQRPSVLDQLLEKWRAPLPLKTGHPALQCGFCGRTFETYEERTEHVEKHFINGLNMMSWWPGRMSHAPLNIKKDQSDNSGLPCRCCYCQRTYPNRAAAQREHPTCSMWSCSFLPGLQYTIYPDMPPHTDSLCCFCNDPLESDELGKVRGNLLKKHMQQHNFRNCSQRLYFSGQRYRQHLQDSHKTNHDGTLFAGWTLLLKSCRQQKPSVFEPVDEDLTIRRVNTDPVKSTQEAKAQELHRPKTAEPRSQDSDHTLRHKSSRNLERRPSRRLRRKASLPDQPGDKAFDGPFHSGHTLKRSATTLDLKSTPTSDDIRMTEQFFEAFAVRTHHHQHHPGFPVNSLPLSHDAGNTYPSFYRRRMDASTRNRIYVREEQEPELSKNFQRLFRKVPRSSFGVLVLHSTLIGTTTVQMTPSVDIYPLH